MIYRKPLNYINQFLVHIRDKIQKLYLNSSFYDKKISKFNNSVFYYRPSAHLLSSIIEYQTKKYDIEVDGGINFSNSKIVKDAGANILVSGTTVFKENNGNLKKNIQTLRLF